MMEQSTRIILIHRKTRLAELVERFNTVQQARFYLEQSGADFADYQQEDQDYRHILEQARRTLEARGRVQVLERAMLPSYRFNTDDTVVVIGQDGLVANTLKYLNGNPVIAINPDPQRWDGVLLPFLPADLPLVIDEVLRRKRSHKEITLARASTNDGQTMLAVNDLFIGPKSHTSARYALHWGAHSEVQSSSGIIISTGLGSTGWYQSLLAMAQGITGTMTDPHVGSGFDWDAKMLMFTVREPFPSKQTGTTLTRGQVNELSPLRIESFMPENGVIFSDGIESDFLTFNAGCTVEIQLNDIAGKLVA
ncbi:sugar kinase [Zhongshania borealis]|uniref:NAD(+)/NADH kinase n=1 Tax=Zhongshania borealis TaxID=889488 RepID=A0ABP7WQY9_9GAMM